MVFNDVIAYLLPNFAFLVIIISYFLYKDQLFGLGFMFGNLLFIVYIANNWRDMLEKMEESEKQVVETEGYLMEILNGIDKIIYRGQTEQEINNFHKKTEHSIDKVFKFYTNANNHGTIMSIMIYIIVCISIGYLIFLFFSKHIDITTFITFFTIILLYRDKMTVIIQQVPDFIEFLGRSDTLLIHFKGMEKEYKRIVNQKHDTKELLFDNIRFENVSFKYNIKETPIFENLNISLNTDNKIIGMVGTSGKGKSTFMKLVLKMYKPSSGAIYIDDHDIDNLSPDYIRSQMTYVNQNSKLFDKKIIDNMLYGCLDKDTCNLYLKEIMQYKKINDLYKNIDIYNQQSGPLGENLSGGQRQIVNIIGGLINPSKILILDEPTNALDPELKRELIALIRDFKKYKKCIIVITHDRDVHSIFDETVNL
jgi:ABC-type bacteriocin/lantibiotic exporter with double-glycine peptidase domain